MTIIVVQILKLTIIGIIGAVAVKTKLIAKQHYDGLVKIIMKICLPLLIFTSFANTAMSETILKNMPYILLLSFMSVGALFILSKISAYILKINKPDSLLFNCHNMFGNVAFLGFPLLDSLFPGGEGLIYAAIFQLGHDSLLWTWGIYIMSRNDEQQKHTKLKHLLNPTTIAFILGIAFMISKIKIPNLIFEPLEKIGHTTIYLSTIYVGAILSNINFKNLLKNFNTYVLCFNKLILGPMIILSIVLVISLLGFDMSHNAIACAVLQSAMPCMIIISVLADEYKLNTKQAAENIFVSTLLSIITLPIVYYIISLTFK